MQIIQNRRDFLASVSAASAAGVLGARSSCADEPPPETTTVRLRRDPSICVAPWYVAEELLAAEGFIDVQYVMTASGNPLLQELTRGEIDFTVLFTASAVLGLDTGVPLTVVAGLHVGCFELFAHEPIRTISDLKGKRVGIDVLDSGKHQYVAIMAAYVGLNPHNDIDWVDASAADPMELFAKRGIDAFLGWPPEPQELRRRNTGRVIVNTATDEPWSQYFCCVVAGNRDFVKSHPVATKRVIRAILKSNDICAAEPERAARYLVKAKFTERYDYALETLSEIRFGSWREFDPEDSMRFYALRLHEIGMIKSSPNKILAEGTDWRFLNELKRELKA
jgi:NitT/TauT family transport system substrate-binding protein